MLVEDCKAGMMNDSGYTDLRKNHDREIARYQHEIIKYRAIIARRGLQGARTKYRSWIDDCESHIKFLQSFQGVSLKSVNVIRRSGRASDVDAIYRYVRDHTDEQLLELYLLGPVVLRDLREWQASRDAKSC